MKSGAISAETRRNTENLISIAGHFDGKMTG